MTIFIPITRKKKNIKSKYNSMVNINIVDGNKKTRKFASDYDEQVIRKAFPYT